MIDPSNVSGPASSLDQLLRCPGPQFVRCAYLTLFGREPDPQGLRYYSDRLRDGHARLAIINQLYRSAESRARGAPFAGLDAALAQFRRGQWPVVGAWFRRRDGIEDNGPAARATRALEFRLEQLAQLVHEQDQHTQQRFFELQAAGSQQRALIDARFVAVDGMLSDLQRFGDEAARQHGAWLQSSKPRFDETREALADIRRALADTTRRFEELEQSLADMQHDLRDGAPLPPPLGPAGLSQLRRLPPNARTLYARLRQVMTGERD